MYFKDNVAALGHTPLVELPRLSPNKKVRILAKMEGQSVGGSGSVKDRIARYMIEAAEASGELSRDRTIIEATSGNTGIALAWLGRRMGYPVTIVMPDSMSRERRQLLKIFGGELVLTDGALGMSGAIGKARELVAGDRKYFMPDQFNNPANPLAHYETTGAEILDDFPYDRINALVCGIGTGGSICGISRRLRESYPDIRVVGVEPYPGDSIQGLKCMDENEVPAVLDLSLITERINVSSREAAAATRRLLKEEGVFAGLSSGAALCQAVKIASEMTSGNIVVVLPDGGWKYLSLDFWTENDAGDR
ncbi:MAG: cysteine synthase family protein [Dehalococcoidales bacterium]|nr:cysteine synthase family protein [Dehalococcoidales bacterium]